MKSRWKSVFLWSSLGSVAVGAVVALAKRARTVQPPPMEYHRIPSDCQTASLWTEQFILDSPADGRAVQDKYVLRITPFKAWSVLEPNDAGVDTRPRGSTIYHITHFRYAEVSGGEGYPDEGKLQDRFYGTVAILGRDGIHSTRNCIARGGILEIRKCRVGGASNGVETEEIHRSRAPILNYRFEYISA